MVELYPRTGGSGTGRRRRDVVGTLVIVGVEAVPF